MEADLGDRETRMWLQTAGAGELELSLVELAVAATCFSEDETERLDLVDGLIESGRIRVSRALPTRNTA